jgi:chromosome segregation ATPase
MSMSDKPEDRIEDLETELQEVEDEIQDLGGDDQKSEDKVAEQTFTKADMDKAVKRRQAALKKARELEAELNRMKAETETETERQVREAAEAARSDAENLFKPALVRKELFYQMASLGLKKDQIPDMVDLIKMSEIEIDEDFNVLGVEEEIDRIKNKFPKLFESEEPKDEGEPKKQRRRIVPKADAADKQEPAPKKLSAADKVRNRLLKINSE